MVQDNVSESTTFYPQDHIHPHPEVSVTLEPWVGVDVVLWVKRCALTDVVLHHLIGESLLHFPFKGQRFTRTPTCCNMVQYISPP